MLTDEELALVAALAENATLRGASKALALPLATVSRRVVALEKRIGEEIYLRKGRLLVPTRAGEVILDRAARAHAAREDLTAALSALREGGGRLTVAASPMFAEIVLPGALAALAERRPDLRIEIRLGHDAAELHAGRIDVALRRGPLGDLSSLRAKKLGRTTMVCVAAARQDLALASDVERRVASLPWVRVGARPEPLVIGWTDRRRRSTSVSPHVTVDSQRVALELVRCGPFAARVNAFLVRDELRDGRLVEVVPEARTTEDVFAVFPDRARPDPRARELVQAVAKVAADARIWDP